ncbi:hypothetical protein OG21DRAFT_1528158 [Imleria badia]|nr:hypothetical protein OG21DRAFT_1528158 [Imleria badia]
MAVQDLLYPGVVKGAVQLRVVEMEDVGEVERGSGITDLAGEWREIWVEAGRGWLPSFFRLSLSGGGSYLGVEVHQHVALIEADEGREVWMRIIGEHSAGWMEGVSDTEGPFGECVIVLADVKEAQGAGNSSIAAVMEKLHKSNRKAIEKVADLVLVKGLDLLFQ